MNNSTETLSAEPGSAIACLIIKTGRNDYLAYFYPALYQLTLIKGGVEEKIDLGYSGSRLLERLLQTPGSVVSREELLSHAWSDRVVGQGSLNQQIYTLRQMLGDEKNREIIQTLPRRGYMINPSYLTRPQNPDNLDRAQEPTVASPSVGREVQRERRFMLALVAVLCLTLTSLLAYLYQISQPEDLYSSELTQGKLRVRYLDHDSQGLQQLILNTHSLISRLAALADRPSSLVLSLRGGFYELLCEQPGGGVRSLMLHESQLARVAEAQLHRCLG